MPHAVEPREWAAQLQAAATDTRLLRDSHLADPKAEPTGTSEVADQEKPRGAVSREEENGLGNRRTPLPDAVGSHDTQSLPTADIQRSTTPTPPRKMLQVRPDGKLSSPKKGNSSFGTRSTRGKTSQNGLHSKDTYLVVIKYGKRKKSRILLGQKIDAILKMPSVDEALIASISARKVASTEPLRPTHPFFTGEIARDLDQKKATTAGNSAGIAPERIAGGLNGRFSTTKMRVNSKPANITEGSDLQVGFGLPTFGSDHARMTRFPGAQEPLWPPADTVRIGPPFEELGIRNAARSSVLKPSAGWKSKEVQMQVSTNEEVLRPLIDLAHGIRAGREVNPDVRSRDTQDHRRPTRRVMTGPQLQHLLCPRLTHSVAFSALNSSQKVDELSDPLVDLPSAPRCLRRVYESIATTRSAFDKFECETSDWVHKYAPQRADEVLQQGRDVVLLRDWLRTLTVSSVGIKNDPPIAKPMKPGRRRRKRAEELDGFVVSSDEEANEMEDVSESEDIQGILQGTKKTVARNCDTTELKDRQRVSHAVVVSGPHGCGKSAAIHAIANELDFEVFEINAGMRRSGKDILDKVGDMTRNHLVKHDAVNENDKAIQEVDEAARFDDKLQQDLDSGRQGTMNSFFQSNGSSKKKQSPKKPRLNPARPESEPQRKPKRQKQSLILLEEVDVLFEEDKMFWITVLDLLHSSRRPVIMTCTDESLVPLNEMVLHGIFRLPTCPQNLAVDYLLLVAGSEGHLLRRDALDSLHKAKQLDLRASLSELNFFCQMAIGDNKGGLEWMLLDAPPQSVGAGCLRVVSEDTYCKGMGSSGGRSPSSLHRESLKGGMHLLSAVEGKSDCDPSLKPTRCKTSIAPDDRATQRDILRALQRADSILEAYSASDTLPGQDGRVENKQPLDPTQPDFTEKMRGNFTEGLTLLQADPVEDHGGITPSPALTLRLYAQQLLRAYDGLGRAESLGENFIDVIPITERNFSIDDSMTKAIMIAAFDPIIKDSKPVLGIPKGSQISCLNRPISLIAEDLAPYIRSIVSYDLRLEEQRRQLSALLAQPGKEEGKARRTRASRAALEGGSKANTRRERWFPNSTNFDLVLQTGSQDWQDAALAIVKAELSEYGSVVDGSRESSQTPLDAAGESIWEGRWRGD